MHEIVRYDPGLKEQIARVQRHLWSEDLGLNTAYFEWKYEQNPYGKVPHLHVAISEGRVVGMRGMFGACWEVGSPPRRVLAPCADDFVIDPEHRNKSLGGVIMRAAATDSALGDYEYAFNLSPGPVTFMSGLVAGWRPVGSMRPVRRTSARSDLVDRMAARLKKMPLVWRYSDPLVRSYHRGLGVFRALDRRGRRVRASSEVRLEVAPPAAAMAELVARLGHDGRIRHVRDETYLRWRYRDPLHDYRFLVRGADRLQGYLVLQAHRVDAERGVRIVDWEATTPEIRTELLRAALEWGHFPEVNAWTASLASETSDSLARVGFVPTSSGSQLRGAAPILIRPVGRTATTADPTIEGRRLLDPTNWDMRMIYSMGG